MSAYLVYNYTVTKLRPLLLSRSRREGFVHRRGPHADVPALLPFVVLPKVLAGSKG
jgi:hypothetical protein